MVSNCLLYNKIRKNRSYRQKTYGENKKCKFLLGEKYSLINPKLKRKKGVNKHGNKELRPEINKINGDVLLKILF